MFDGDIPHETGAEAAQCSCRIDSGPSVKVAVFEADEILSTPRLNVWQPGFSGSCGHLLDVAWPKGLSAEMFFE